MKSRTSFFEPTVFKKDVTRFLPVWLLYGIFMLMGNFSIIDVFSDSGTSAMTLAESITPMAITQMIYALISAECLFGDLFNQRMCNAVHALPVRREQLFLTHSAAGLLFSLVPNTVIALLLILKLWNYWYIALLWLLGVSIWYLFFFALAAVCAVSSGSRVAMAAVYLLVNFLSMIIYWIVTTCYEPLLPGLHIRADFLTWFCPVVQLPLMDDLVRLKDKSLVSFRCEPEFLGLSGDWWYPAVLAVLGVILLGLGIVLYRRRKLEKAGEFIVFRRALPVCSVIFTLTVAAVFREMGVLMGIEPVTMTVGFVVGCFGTEMLLRRTVKVFDRKTVIKCAVIGGAFVLSIVAVSADPAGLTRWTPEPEQVESIILSSDYDYDPEYEALYGYYDSAVISDQERIAQLVQAHESLLTENLDETSYYLSGRTGAVHLTYQMKDGSEVERRYYYDMDSTAGKLLEELYNMPEFILGYRDWEDYIADVEYAYVDCYIGSDYKSIELFGAEAVALAKAVKADCEAGAVSSEYTDEDIYYISIGGNVWSHVNITPECTQTVAWLETYLAPACFG